MVIFHETACIEISKDVGKFKYVNFVVKLDYIKKEKHIYKRSDVRADKCE